jgi:hypothetical protein
MTCPSPTPVIFYYNIEDFFNLSSIESMYRSENVTDQAGLNRMDYMALTVNDKQFYDTLLKRAAADCYAVLQPLVKGAPEGFVFDGLPVRTVAQLNAITEIEEGLYYKLSDAGSLTDGAVAVVKGDKVYHNGTIWVKDNATAPSYIFFTVSLPWNFDLNNKFGLDQKIKEFISIFVVYHWFRRKNFSLELITPEFTELRKDLGMIVNYRITVNRASRTF